MDETIVLVVYLLSSKLMNNLDRLFPMLLIILFMPGLDGCSKFHQ